VRSRGRAVWFFVVALAGVVVGLNNPFRPSRFFSKAAKSVRNDVSEAERLRQQVELLRKEVKVLEEEAEVSRAEEEARWKRRRADDEAKKKKVDAGDDNPILSQEAREILERWEPALVELVEEAARGDREDDGAGGDKKDEEDNDKVVIVVVGRDDDDAKEDDADAKDSSSLPTEEEESSLSSSSSAAKESLKLKALKRVEETAASLSRSLTPAFQVKPKMEGPPKTLAEVNRLFSKERTLTWCGGAQFWEASQFAEAMNLESDEYEVYRLEMSGSKCLFEASPGVCRLLHAGPVAEGSLTRTPAVARAAERAKNLGLFPDIFDHDDFDVDAEIVKHVVGEAAWAGILGAPDTCDPIVADLYARKFDRNGLSGEALKGSLFYGGDVTGDITTAELRKAFAERVDDCGRFVWRRWKQGVAAGRRNYLYDDDDADEGSSEDDFTGAASEEEEDDGEVDDDDSASTLTTTTKKKSRQKAKFLAKPQPPLSLSKKPPKKIDLRFSSRFGGEDDGSEEVPLEMKAILGAADDSFLRWAPKAQLFALLEGRRETGFFGLDWGGPDLFFGPTTLKTVETRLVVTLAQNPSFKETSFEFAVADARRQEPDDGAGREQRWDAVRFAHRSVRAAAASVVVLQELILQGDTEGFPKDAMITGIARDDRFRNMARQFRQQVVALDESAERRRDVDDIFRGKKKKSWRRRSK